MEQRKDKIIRSTNEKRQQTERIVRQTPGRLSRDRVCVVDCRHRRWCVGHNSIRDLQVKSKRHNCRWDQNQYAIKTQNPIIKTFSYFCEFCWEEEGAHSRRGPSYRQDPAPGEGPHPPKLRRGTTRATAETTPWIAVQRSRRIMFRLNSTLVKERKKFSRVSHNPPSPPHHKFVL